MDSFQPPPWEIASVDLTPAVNGKQQAFLCLRARPAHVLFIRSGKWDVSTEEDAAQMCEEARAIASRIFAAYPTTGPAGATTRTDATLYIPLGIVLINSIWPDRRQTQGLQRSLTVLVS